jgi:hypothetical protein
VRTRSLPRDTSGAVPETEAERRARIAYERALIEEAEAEIAAGHGIEGEDATALLRALGEGRPFPVPNPSDAGRR